MTLIVSPGEDVLSSSSDDGDSGCLAGSPDLKEESLGGKHHDLFLTSKLKRLSLQDVKALHVSSEESERQEGVPSSTNATHSLDVQSENVPNQINIRNGDTRVALKPEDADCDKKSLSEKEKDTHGIYGSSKDGSHATPKHMLIYDCNDVTTNGVDPHNTKATERKLEGPAVVSSPIIHLASQVHCQETVRISDCVSPPLSQKNPLKMHLVPCNNNSSGCNDRSCSLPSRDVNETLPSARLPTLGKCTENGDELGGLCERVTEAPKVDSEHGDLSVSPGVSVNGGDSNVVRESTGSINVCEDKDVHGHKNDISKENGVNEDSMYDSVKNNSPSSGEVRSEVDIRQAKEKINILRHNFLSSLSADDDFDQPDFIVLPHHSDHPEEEEEQWFAENDNKRQTEGKEEDVNELDLERKNRCSVKVTEVTGGGVQEAGEVEEEEEEEEKSKLKKNDKVEEGEEQQTNNSVPVSVPGAEAHSGGCQVKQQSTFYDGGHLEKDIQGNATTTQEEDNLSPSSSSLEGVPRRNVLSAKLEEQDRVSSVKLLVSEASARLMEQEISESDEALGLRASSDVDMCGNVGNVLPEDVVTTDTTRLGEDGVVLESSLAAIPQTSPPSELPPSLPPSPPPPPSSPQSPGLFSRDSSGSPPNYSKSQSANLVNLLMLQSRKHKRLHRLRLPENSSSSVTSDKPCAEGDEGEGIEKDEKEVKHVLRNDEECEKRLQIPQQQQEEQQKQQQQQQQQSLSAQPPQQLENLHVRPPSPSFSSCVSPSTSSSFVATNAHCGSADQLVLCRSDPLLPHPPPPPPLSLSPPPPPPPPSALCPLHPHSSSISTEGQSLHHYHNPSWRNLPPGVDRSARDWSQLNKVLSSCPNNDQRNNAKTTSLLKKFVDGEAKGDGVCDSESVCSDTSCLGYLNFDHESLVDSDNEYDIEQKNKLKEACKDIARALNTLPSLPDECRPSGGEPPPPPPPPSVVCCSRPAEVMYHDSRPQYRDQQVEAHLSDTDDPLNTDGYSVQVRSCGTSTASDDDRRNSFYDNNCGTNGGPCECGRCNNSSDVELTLKDRFPPPLPPPPSSPPPPPIPPLPPQSAMESLRKSPRHRNPKRNNNKAHSGRRISDHEVQEECIRSDVGDGCRTDEFDACTTSDDNDYDDDYCQTDDCGEECDYCSGDDAEDEAEDTCYFCKHSQNVSPVCKHPGVITNGILKSYNGRGRERKECGARGVPHGRSLALQAAIHRRRLTRQGLVAIRESSITSDELPESEEEEIEEEEEIQSYDGSNCDISSSWRFGLCRDLTAMSRDSTLRSVRSDRSSSSLPAEHIRQRHKEKSNSLPGANSRSIAGDIQARLSSSSGVGIGAPYRQVSTSDDESGSHSSLPRLPPRPPRAPRMRPPLTPSPPAGGLFLPPASPSSPRPAMGLQGLQQQRSPGASRAIHVSGLPVAPRTVAPRSPSNPNPPYGFPSMVSSGPAALLCPGSPSLQGRSTPSPGGGSDGPPASPRINSRAGALVTRNFSISDDESGGRWSSGRRHVTITRHESVYKEVAEKGYHLPPGSPVDPYWLTWKLGVLQKTVEEVSGRLDEAQKTADGWGPLSHDPNLADQHAHNVRKFREGLAELQRGVDDVNDQAARFSAHNVPLTPANSAKLHDLNNRWKSLETSVNDRWRQVASRSREVTPLTPAQLASSVSPPWERATTSNKVPYYINHDQESTHWDHPIMMDLLDTMNEFNHIKFSAYRTATKLRVLQKKLALDLAKLQMATDIFDEHGLRGQNDRLIDVGDMVVVLSALYANISADHPEVDTTLAMDLCLNWLLNVYDSQRTGQMRVLSFKIGLVCLCCGHLEEKYRYMFRLIADPNRLVDQRKLGLLLHDCVQVPRQLGEVAAFGGSNIEPSVRSCFTKAGKDRETIEAVHFLTWVQQEPQSLVWLAVLHRVAASENIQHQVKCNICKAYPIVGLRYRCLKCLSFDMCQRCFFEGRSGKSHKITHPMHEYCTATTAGEDVKDFTKALKNKFKSKRSLQKHTKKGYLPVQTVLEGDPLESPSPSPQHNVTSQDMHSRLELYASRLAEVELRTNSNSTPDSEDEHGLIAQYCQSLSSSDAPLPVPRSPLQIMAAVDADQKDELEQMIRALEEENSVLQAEYDRLKSQQPVGSPPDDGLAGQRSEADMLAEAKLLRQHKGRLEARMGILEEHNRQLEAQLHRLRQLLGEPGVSSPNKSGTLQTKSVTASQLAMDSPAKVNGHSTQGGATSAYEGLEQMSEYVRPPPPPMGSVAHVGNLFSRAAPYRSSGWRPGEGGWHSGGHNDPRGGERLA